MKKDISRTILITMDIQDFEQVIENAVHSSISKIQNIKDQDSATSLNLMKRKDVMDLFGVTSVTIRKWTKNGQLPKPIRKGRLLFYNKDEVLQVFKNNKR